MTGVQTCALPIWTRVAAVSYVICPQCPALYWIRLKLNPIGRSLVINRVFFLRKRWEETVDAPRVMRYFGSHCRTIEKNLICILNSAIYFIYSCIKFRDYIHFYFNKHPKNEIIVQTAKRLNKQWILTQRNALTIKHK